MVVSFCLICTERGTQGAEGGEDLAGSAREIFCVHRDLKRVSLTNIR